MTGQPSEPNALSAPLPAARPARADAGREVELKLYAAPADLPRIPEIPLIASYAAEGMRRSRQHTGYYDTHNLDLARRGLAIRLRREDGRCIQAVKTMGGGSSDAAGVAIRREWEWEVDGGGLDIGPLRRGELAAILPAESLDQLQPVFATEIQRTVLILRPWAGTEIEMALDLGQVIANPGNGATTHRAISEVELELKAGRLADLFRLAAEIHTHIPLRLATLSKAHMGLALLTGRQPEARPAPPLGLTPFTTVAEAFRHMGRNGLAQLLDNEPAFLAASDPDALREMAAAVRRLDAAFGLFKDVIATPEAAELRARLKTLGESLETARLWDRVAERTLPATLYRSGESRRLCSAVAGARRKARLEALEMLASPHWTGWMLDFAAWLEGGEWAAGQPFDEPMQDLAPGLLRQRLGKCDRAARKLKGKATRRKDWLKLWKRVQRLRYALDYCRTICGPDSFRPLLAAVDRIRVELKRAAEADEAITGLAILAEAADKPLLKEIQDATGQLDKMLHTALKSVPDSWDAVRGAAEPMTGKS